MVDAVDVKAEREPLEDLMIAMDVVDTLRHRQGLVERELDSEGRRERLIARLREIYTSQGIEVTDKVLEEGVRALEEDRFSYEPPEPSFTTRLAHVYVHRGSWAKPLLLAVLIGVAGWLAYFFTVTQPRAEQAAALPLRIESAYSEIERSAQNPQVREQAMQLRDAGLSAVDESSLAAAVQSAEELELLQQRLLQTFEVRIVSRPNALSGVWRVPDVNPDARNYYLIVEAVDSSGALVSVSIESEEDQTQRMVTSWGVRVNERTFEAVAADKRDDGIIQDDVVGRKVVGKLEPDYVVATTGATITDW